MLDIGLCSTHAVDMRNEKHIEFSNSLNRNGIDFSVIVSATVGWSSGMDDRGYQSGFMAEDIEAKSESGETIKLTKEEIQSFEEEAIREYLK